MTDQGLSFSLAAYPSPDHFRFFHLGNRTSGNGSEVSSGRFSSLCLQNALTLSTVNCTITPVDVPKALLGFYRAIVSNDLGIVDITFSVGNEGNGLWMYSGSLHRFDAKVILRQNINYKTTSTTLFHFSCPKPLPILRVLRSCAQSRPGSQKWERQKYLVMASVYCVDQVNNRRHSLFKNKCSSRLSSMGKR